MSTNIVNDFLHKLSLKLDALSNKKVLNAIYIGNGGDSLLSCHFEFSNHVGDLFGQPSLSDISDLDTIIIIGSLNLNQVQKLKSLYNRLGSKTKYVIQVKTSLSDDEAKAAYFICNDLEGYINVDLVYNRYPIDMDDLFLQIKELKDGIHGA
jgi:hypothetical protein